MKILIKISLFIMLLSFSTQAQVTINKSIIFKADTLTIENLSTPADTSNAIPHASVIGEELLLSNQNSNLWTISILNFSGPITGMTFTIDLNQPITDTVTVQFNTNGPYNIYYKNTKLNQSSGITKNLKITFIDTAFFVVDYHQRTCPTGFVKMNSHYCIEVNENPALFIIDAVNDCNTKGGKLCTWSQWYYACQNLRSTYPNFTDNWEFIDGASDHTQMIDVVGLVNCYSNSTQVTTNQGFYRCCYDF